jgi:predicted MFS family arabinose efflux permease
MVGISISLWHPPALSTLSARLRDRLGFALSVHGMGGEIGNTVGPLVLGFLIGAVAWRMAAQIMTVPVVIFAVGLWLALRNFPGREGSKVSGRQYLAALNDLFRNRVILGILVSRGFMHMGTGSVFAFFSLYLQQDLGFSPSKAGMYYAVLMGSGIVSQPLMGYLSDRVGRKVVIVPSIFVLGLSTGALVWAGGETGLLLTAIAIGLFIYSVGAIVQAAAMDVTDERAGATTIGLLFASSSLFGIPSPVIAGAISTAFGTKSVFLYSGAMMVLAALIMAPLPMGRAPGRETGGGARSPH